MFLYFSPGAIVSLPEMKSSPVSFLLVVTRWNVPPSMALPMIVQRLAVVSLAAALSLAMSAILSVSRTGRCATPGISGLGGSTDAAATASLFMSSSLPLTFSMISGASTSAEEMPILLFSILVLLSEMRLLSMLRTPSSFSEISVEDTATFASFEFRIPISFFVNLLRSMDPFA